MSEIFGYKWLTSHSAIRLFRESKNIYVKFYYTDMHTNRLKESKLFLLDKSKLITHMSMTQKDKIFNNSMNHVLMSEIFPHKIMETFYYTDNRTTTPKQSQKDTKSNDFQLSMEF